MFEEIEVIYTTIKIMRFWGFLYESNWRRYISLVMTTFTSLSLLGNLILTEESFETKIRKTYVNVLWINTILRCVLLIYQKDKYGNILTTLESMYMKIKQTGDDFIQQLIDETNIVGKKMTWFNLFLGVLTCLGLVLYPIFVKERVLPYGAIVPGIDINATPYYEVFFMFQVIVTPMGCCMYIPYTCLVVGLIMFAILMCKILQYRLRTLQQPNMTHQTVAARLRWCIKFQIKIINYIKTVNNLTNYMFLFEFIAFGSLLCALLFLLIIVNTLGEAVIVGAYITMTFGQILAIYWFANELQEETLNVAAAIYETDWFDLNIREQKSVLLLLLRAQSPASLTVGNIHPMNLKTFQSLLNMSYSYFTLLKRIYT